MSTSNAPTKMKALVYRDANQVEVVEKDIPTPGPGEVVVKVTTSGLW
jgi:D-arabinose 1-dehydrogenase-like Zn-dependent alcohol dehydrogenase